MSNKHKSRKGQKQPGQREVVTPHLQPALLDICMPIYGEWSFAEKALDCIPQAMQGLNDPYRVIVVDNGTPAWSDQTGATVSPADQAIAVRHRLRPEDYFFRIEENEGYPAGCNKAVARGSSPLILILTADVYLFPGAIAAMVRAMDDPTVGIVGPLLLFPEGTRAGPAGRVQHAGVAFDIRGKPFHQFIGWTPENPRVARSAEVAAVTGACFITRRSLWRQIGGFAEVYGKGTYEDMEYCFAVRSGGAKVLYLAEAKGYHVVGGSIQGGANKSAFAIPLNETVFKGRWAHMLAWDEWRRW